jgi:hypothetical protein
MGGHLDDEGCIMFSYRLVAVAFVCGLLGAASPLCAQSPSLEDPPTPTAGYGGSTQSAVIRVAINRGDIESMPQLVESLLDAITQLSSFRKPATIPHVTRASREEIERTICDGPCMVKAWYRPDEGVFLDETLRPESNLIHRSILLHELVHFVQEENGEGANLDPCHRWVQREQQAYELQAQYLAVIGDDSGLMQKVSAQSALVGARTVCRGWDRPADAAEQPRQVFTGARSAPRQ